MRAADRPVARRATSLPESGIVDFTNPDAYAWWRDAHQPLFEDGVDVIKSDFGEQVPDDAVAFNGDDGAPAAQRLSAALQPLRVRGDRALPAAGGRAADRLEPLRRGRAASAIRSAGAAIRKATGKASPRRYAAGCRGA